MSLFCLCFALGRKEPQAECFALSADVMFARGRLYIRECTFEYTFIGLCKSDLLSVNLGNHGVYSS